MTSSFAPGKTYRAAFLLFLVFVARITQATELESPLALANSIVDSSAWQSVNLDSNTSRIVASIRRLPGWT